MTPPFLFRGRVDRRILLPLRRRAQAGGADFLVATRD